MIVKEKAREYALNALSQEISKIEQAYIDGYKEAQSELGSTYVDEAGVEYIDLGLPSGTCWAKDALKDANGNICKLPYIKAENYNLPTRRQLRELSSCKRLIYPDYAQFIGRNGERLNLLYKNTPFWVKTDENVAPNSYNCSSSNCEDLYEYMGCSLQILLVKNKEDLK